MVSAAVTCSASDKELNPISSTTASSLLSNYAIGLWGNWGGSTATCATARWPLRRMFAGALERRNSVTRRRKLKYDHYIYKAAARGATKVQ
jgi:hypothetical protein